MSGAIEPVPFKDAMRVWGKIGLLSFGGPAGQIATMHRLLVEERGWLSEDRFLRALNFCMLLPGPEAQQLATYAGWLTHGVRGGVVAGLLFILPGAVFMMLLSALYALYGTLPTVDAVFLGVKAAVLAIVAQALMRVSRKALSRRMEWGIAGSAFIALFVFSVPFPLVVLGAAFMGAAFFAAPTTESTKEAIRGASAQTFQPALVSAVLWVLPIGLAWLWLGNDNTFTELGLFFSKVAVVTFGGAYAVLSYVGEQAVEVYGWMQPGAMLDGLGLAETTPGPLVLVNMFVGFQAGYGSGGAALWAGIVGAAMTLWVTFAPSFLWIFTGAPYLDRLQQNRRLAGALRAITAAIVGVIANLAVWFSLHTLFASQTAKQIGGWTIDLPLFQSLQPDAAILTLATFFGLFALRMGLFTLLLCAGIGGFLLSLVI